MNNNSEDLLEITNINDVKPTWNEEFLLQNGEIDTSWMTRAQKRFLEVLKDSSNREKTSAEITKLAGYASPSTWSEATSSGKFSKLLIYLGVDLYYASKGFIINKDAQLNIIDDFESSNIETYDTSWMTWSMKIYFEALINEENRKLSITKLSKKIGLLDNQQWYIALTSARFRNIVRKLGKNIDEVEKRYAGEDIIDLLNINSYDDSWMSTSQKKLFQLIKDKDKRTLPIQTLLSLACISHKSFYKMRKSERYKKLLSNFGIELTPKSQYMANIKAETFGSLRRIYYDIDRNNLDNLDTSWMTKTEKNFYEVFKDKNNKDKTLNDIIEISGYKGHGSWIKVTANEKFRYLLVLMGYAKFFAPKKLAFLSDFDSINCTNLGEDSISWMSKSQEKIFCVLKNKNNINLDVKDIVKLAGFKGTKAWYTAIKDERFSKLLTSLGVPLRRVNDPYPGHNEVKYIKNPKERHIYLEGDVWDMRKLFETYPLHSSPN